MADVALGIVVALAVDKIAEVVFNGAKTMYLSTLRFNSFVKEFECRVEYLELEIEKDLVDDQNSRNLQRMAQKARALLNKCRRVGRRNRITRSYYTWKIHKLIKDLKIHVEIMRGKIQREILELVRTARIGKTNMQRVDSTDVQILIIRQFQIACFKSELDVLLKANPLKDEPSINPNDVVDYDAETETEAPSFHVGLDVPLRELKRKVFTDGVSRLVVTGNRRCGKTELVKQFCQDDEIQDKFKGNIFFVTVSKRPNLDYIIHQLYQQMGSEASTFHNNVSEVKWLEQFIREAGQNPLLLVLDDVWSGSESLLQKLDEFIELNKVSNYKLLVTSRTEFPRFGSSYNLMLSNIEDAMDLVPLKWLATRTIANSVVPRMERREVLAVDDLRVEFKAEIEEVKRDHTNISQRNQGLVTLIQCKDEKGPERTEENRWHGMDVDTVIEDFKLTPELQILATDLVQQKMRQFRAWIADPDDGRRDLKVFVASKKWFKDLMIPGVWLTDTHVDAFLYFVRNNPHYHPQSLTHSCTVLDTVFWNNTTSYEWDSDILDYPLGKSPQFTRQWSEVDYLYIPVNISDQHWVAVRVDLMRRKFTIYDSMQSASRDEFICDLLNPLATMFPSLLIQSGFYEMRPELSPLNTPFQVVRQAESIPQQSESGDCGVFMLKFVEYLSSGQQLICFKDKDIPAFRERMAFRLFAMSHDIGGNNAPVS
ncbi:uncharacterized protein LOC126787285 isoform X2 [Argentina anserina]|uniref:uncharacterized protein LOC126787285 isoform X2 n=1 Tax=Argentina anserina TaxID=57926 RepID=UPI0021763641|nr:uncharacterized protein LOC126787285 isoform X2 [Potentilla anserina]